MPHISTAAIERATGKPWQEWMAWFEQINAAQLSTEELTQQVYEQNVPTWWARQVAMAYEQERGKSQ